MSRNSVPLEAQDSTLVSSVNVNPSNNALYKQIHTYFENLINSVDDAIITLDKDAKIVLFNTAAERIFNHCVSDVLGQPIDMLMAPAYQTRFKHNIDKFSETGDISHFERNGREVHARRLDGSIFPISFSSKVFTHGDETGFSVTVKDISKVYDDNETLLLSQERFSLAVEATNDGLWDWNIKDNSVYYGAKWRDLLDIDTSIFTGQLEPWLARLHPEDHDAVFMALSAVKLGKNRTLEIEARMQMGDESYRWFLGWRF